LSKIAGARLCNPQFSTNRWGRGERGKRTAPAHPKRERYADHLIVMKNGEVVATGAPVDIMTADLVEDVFGLPCLIIDDSVSKTPLIVPKGGHWQA